MCNNKNFIRDSFDLINLFIADGKKSFLLGLEGVKLEPFLFCIFNKIFFGEKVEAIPPVLNFPFLSPTE